MGEDELVTGAPHSRAGYPLMPQTRPLVAVRKRYPAWSTSYPLAPVGTRAQALVTPAGGLSPGGASPGVPKSTTTATRLYPGCAATEPHTDWKSGPIRGGTEVPLAPTANRQPSTAPSAGLLDGPPVA